MLRPTAYKIRLSPSLVGFRKWVLAPAARSWRFSPVTSHQSRPSLHERGNPRNPLADHQLMNVVRPLVGRHALEIVHVPHDAVIVHAPVCAEDIARLSSRFLSYRYVVQLQHRGVCSYDRAGVL